jgi:hypothetical protein
MLQAVRDDLDEKDPAFWPNDLLQRYLNRSYRWVRSEIVKIHDGLLEREKTITYPGGRQATFAALGLPDQPLSIVLLEDISTSTDKGIVIDHVDYIDESNYRLRTGTIVDSASFRNTVYYISGDDTGARVLGLRPQPSGTKTLRMIYVPGATALAADGDTPEIPDDFHEAIVLRAVILAKKREEAPAQDYERELDRVMRTAILTLEGRDQDRYPRTHVHDPSVYQYDW